MSWTLSQLKQQLLLGEIQLPAKWSGAAGALGRENETRADRFLVVSCGTQQSQLAWFCGEDGRVKAARRAPAGLGLDAIGWPATLDKGLTAMTFLAGNPDDRGRLAPFPLAGRAGGRVTAGGWGCDVAFHTKRHRAPPARPVPAVLVLRVRSGFAV